MTESYQVGAKAYSLKGNVDVSKHVFGIVDELANHFGNELKAAQAKVEQAEKSAATRKPEAKESREPNETASSNRSAGEAKNLSERQKQAAEGEVSENAEEAMAGEGTEETSPMGEEGAQPVAIRLQADAAMPVETPDEPLEELAMEEAPEEVIAPVLAEQVAKGPKVEEENDLQLDPEKAAATIKPKAATTTTSTERGLRMEIKEEEEIDEGNLPRDDLNDEEVDIVSKPKADTGERRSTMEEASLVKPKAELGHAQKQNLQENTLKIETPKTQAKATTELDENLTNTQEQDLLPIQDEEEDKLAEAPSQDSVIAAAPREELKASQPVEEKQEEVAVSDKSKEAEPAKRKGQGLLARLTQMIRGKKEQVEVVDDASMEEVSQELADQEEAPETPEQTAAEKEPVAAPRLSRAAEEKLEPQNFHSIRPPMPAGAMPSKNEQSANILKTLSDFSQQSRMAQPVPEKISDQLFQGLKLSQPSMAQELQQSRNVPLYTEEARLAEEPNTPAQRTRFEELQEKVVRQIQFNLRMAVKGKRSELNLQLHPPMLGKVKVKMLMEMGVAKAHFTVDNHTVKEALQRSLPALQSALAEQGLEVASVEVNVANDHHAQDQNGRSFASEEDQEAARQWLASFKIRDEVVGLKQTESEAPATVEEGDLDGVSQIVNIMA